MSESFEEKELLEMDPRLVLHVFRHDEKDQAVEDTLAPLTSKGRANALAAGKAKQPKINQGYVVCSPRDRALHSGLLQFFGPCLDMEGVEQKSLTELAGLLKEKGHAEKVKVDDRLNFKVEDVAEFNDRFYAEYNNKQANRTLFFQLDESDQLILDIAKKTPPVTEHPVTKVKGYTQMVGDLAEIFSEYLAEFEIWKEAYEKDPTKFDSRDLQIFIATHSQNLECFLMEVIRLKEGQVGLDKFLAALPHHKSFLGYSEGCEITVEGLNMEVNYAGKSYSIKKTDLQTMVAARNQFNQKVIQNLQAAN